MDAFMNLMMRAIKLDHAIAEGICITVIPYLVSTMAVAPEPATRAYASRAFCVLPAVADYAEACTHTKEHHGNVVAQYVLASRCQGYAARFHAKLENSSNCLHLETSVWDGRVQTSSCN